MRIVAGSLKGRKLAAPEGAAIRPTSDRAREALFNRLVHGGLGPDGGSILHGAEVLDAFCGTGALGFEALSRGAARATFLDNSAEALAWVRRNARSLGVMERCRILQRDALHPAPPDIPATLAFLDPPYGEGLAEPALAALAEAGWFAPGAVVSVEIPAKRAGFTPPGGFTTLDDRTYGKARIVLLRVGG